MIINNSNRDRILMDLKFYGDVPPSLVERIKSANGSITLTASEMKILKEAETKRRRRLQQAREDYAARDEPEHDGEEGQIAL